MLVLPPAALAFPEVSRTATTSSSFLRTLHD